MHSRAQETDRCERRRETAAGAWCLMECEAIYLLFFYFPHGRTRVTPGITKPSAGLTFDAVRMRELAPGRRGHAGHLHALSSEQDFAEGRLVGSKSEIFQRDMSLPWGLRGVVGAVLGPQTHHPVWPPSLPASIFPQADVCTPSACTRRVGTGSPNRRLPGPAPCGEMCCLQSRSEPDPLRVSELRQARRAIIWKNGFQGRIKGLSNSYNLV